VLRTLDGGRCSLIALATCYVLHGERQSTTTLAEAGASDNLEAVSDGLTLALCTGLGLMLYKPPRSRWTTTRS
jgi:hypothetical protein